MTRNTSVKAYRNIMDNGLLSKRRAEVYAYLYINGPCTAKQVSKCVPGGWKRLSELEERTLAKPVDKVICDVTGQTVLLWDVTSNLPIDPPKKPKKKKLPTGKKQLQTEITRLQKRLKYIRTVKTKRLTDALRPLADMKPILDEFNGNNSPNIHGWITSKGECNLTREMVETAYKLIYGDEDA